MTGSSSCRSATPAFNSRQLSSEIPSENTRRRLTSKLFHRLKGTDHGQQYSDAVRSNTADHQAEDDFESTSEVIMSIDVKERCIGCCYYTARDETMYFMEDMKLAGLDVVEKLRLHVGPNVVLTSTKTDDTVVECLDPALNSKSGDDEHHLPTLAPYLFQVRPSAEYRYEVSKTKLANLELDGDSDLKASFLIPTDIADEDGYQDYSNEGTTSYQGRILNMGGMVDLNSRISIGCAGALLAYLQRKRAGRFLPGDEAANQIFCVSRVEMFSLKDTMFVNPETISSLQIMLSESHPNYHNQGPTSASSGSKESLSVYGLFHHLARTSQGKLALRQYFLRPSMNISVINERLGTISMLLKPENAGSLENISKNLAHIKNLRQVMIQLTKGVASSTNKGGGIARGIWATIRQSVYHALKIRDSMEELEHAEILPIRNKILEHFEAYHLSQIGRKINSIVDFDSSAEENRTVVLRNIDEELDQLKHTWDGLDQLLDDVTQAVSIEVNRETQMQINLRVGFFPQIGFLTAIPSDDRSNEDLYDGTVEDPWERMFVVESIVYYKNKTMREMDEYFGDIYGLICDREIEIIHELAEDILHYKELLATVSDLCGDLDSLTALAHGASMYKLARPRVVEENILHIKAGRHPLQELTVPSFVANDTFLMGGRGQTRTDSLSTDAEQETISAEPNSGNVVLNGPSMLMLTGPNYSGKSVLLKQVALIAYMAHIGSFVPADRAVIGLTDKILTRVHTRESVSKVQSAFMLDLQQTCLALNLSTHRSLIIVDEFGKGTNSCDGAGLACAVFEHLLSLGDDRPKVVAATHFHEIFESHYLKPQPSLAFGYMEVLINTDAEKTDDQVTYLYNLRKGRSVSSFGICCAAMSGIPAKITDRAEHLAQLAARGENLVAACTVMSDEEIEELQDGEHVARYFLEEDLEKDPRHILEGMFGNY